jgi:hypothetical protein
MSNLKKRGVGRPAGKDFPNILRVYENDEGVRLAQALARARGMSVAGLYRDLLRTAARRAGITQQLDLNTAAAGAREQYVAAEAREWTEADDPVLEEMTA